MSAYIFQASMGVSEVRSDFPGSGDIFYIFGDIFQKLAAFSGSGINFAIYKNFLDSGQIILWKARYFQAVLVFKLLTKAIFFFIL